MVKGKITLLKCIVMCLLFLSVANVSFANEGETGPRKAEIIKHPDGSMTIITYGVDEKGREIKTVTHIRITEFLDGTKIVSKSVKIYSLATKEVLTKSYVQTNVVRPRRRSYSVPDKYNPRSNSSGGGGVVTPDVTSTASPDGA